MDCFRLRSLSYGGQVVACAPLHKRFAFVQGNDGRTNARQPTAFRSSGTAASYFELCSTSDVLTLRTCGAAVRWVTKSWNVAMSGATHFRMKATSPDNIQHSRTNGSARTNASNARKSASAWLDRWTDANTVTSKPSRRGS